MNVKHWTIFLFIVFRSLLSISQEEHCTFESLNINNDNKNLILYYNIVLHSLQKENDKKKISERYLDKIKVEYFNYKKDESLEMRIEIGFLYFKFLKELNQENYYKLRSWRDEHLLLL